jgi:hypothetical protein
MIQISKDDEKDILALLDLKSTFRNKNAISKLIWSEYLQKKTSEMCARVLGTGIKCGIYKLTDMTTNQCYIGQSVNIGA